MTRPGRTRRVRVTEIAAGGTVRREDRLATEEPLEIRIDAPDRGTAQRYGITMRTPGNDFELAAGLLLAEGIYLRREDIGSIAYCTDADLSEDEEYNVVTVRLTGQPRAEWSPRTMSSACGVCGAQSVAEVTAAARTPDAEIRLDPDVVATLPDKLRSSQRIFASTGALHAAGLFDSDGTPRVVREDVGRHNAVDKVIGHCVLQEHDPQSSVLCVSGRIAFEIVQKAAVAGITAVVAVGAPTSLAVQTATDAGITLAGFVRDDRMVIYSHAHRLT